MALERVLDWPCSERPREQPASELEDAGVGECRSGPDRLEIKPLFTPSERPRRRSNVTAADSNRTSSTVR